MGKSEAVSVMHLQTRVNKKVLHELKQAVAQRGMMRFLTHDLIVRCIFNDGFSSGVGPCEPWAQELTNGEDNFLVLFLQSVIMIIVVFCLRIGVNLGSSGYVQTFT